MESLLLFVLAGFLAQLVNGSLGMGYGALSTTGLLAVGVPPAPASAAVHYSQVGIALASGVSHWKFRNIDWRTVGILALAGGVGAAAGAYALVALSEFSLDAATVWIASILCLLGLYVLIRFSFLKLGKLITEKRPDGRFFGPLGLIAGFTNATGGGGWGPIATSTLLSSGRLEPRKVIGSVSAAELSVAVAGSAAFLVVLGAGGIDFRSVVGLLIGGVLAAPVAAWLAQRVPPRLLGALAGGMIVLTNTWLLSGALEVGTAASLAAYVAVLALWITAIAAALRSMREERKLRAAIEADIERNRRSPGDEHARVR
ncbi:sulfite exporter TauE/SafE family protein [Haloechinothrix sp. LS1_15]|uniref:sulfite exporter TauE/SafE family protein n=1 Tax=Haloechinothrix sp. LS1_15 TaxID=2652248 RepID=UPI0029481D8A|nr:sulfite exporter TauE/SafE family protein [Haloechinothrix sp. LS1_15]MDV6011195.1 sulfite exporter TauE/SafE family protein [Haloechinothrix sp. LS1_15]